MAVSPLIMVRFEKFEIVCNEDFGPDLAYVRMTSRVTSFARWRHTRDILHDVIEQKVDLVDLSHYATSLYLGFCELATPPTVNQEKLN